MRWNNGPDSDVCDEVVGLARSLNGCFPLEIP
jgi:hypothetical protein